MRRSSAVVGIMTEIRGQGERLFGPQDQFLRELLQAGDELGQLCYVFVPEDIDFATRQIQGRRWLNGRWVRRAYTFPDVIYPRDFGFSPAKRRLRQRLTEQGCKFTSPMIIGKWRSWQLLSAYPRLRRYLPETRLWDGEEELRRMLSEYATLYIKPVDGSQGRNIMRVHKRGDRAYEVRYNRGDGSRRLLCGSVTALYAQLKRIMRARPYIMQEEIRLLRLQGGIVDVRVLAQKDGTARWRITGKACRVGQSGSITSNISGGGRAHAVAEVLDVFFPEAKCAAIMKELDELALAVVEHLERHMETVGEMGIDIGVDVSGRLWFIEANLRPARYVFVQLGDKQTRLLAVRRPMEFAQYLATNHD